MNNQKMTNSMALRRWRNVHHTFFTYISVLLVCHQRLQYALGKGDLARAKSILINITAILRASTVAFRLAADMPTELYEGYIRRTMEPPHTQPGFSGLLLADHRHLITSMKKCRELLKRYRSEVPAALYQYWGSWNTCYDTHANVCEKAVGPAPSLLSNKKSGYDLLTSNYRPAALRSSGCPMGRKLS